MSRARQAEATGGFDLAVVVVSHDSGRWLRPCLDSIAGHAGEARLEIVVVENGGTTETREITDARTTWIPVPNRGFAHALNVGVAATTAPYVLLVNPDIEVTEGRLDQLLHVLAENRAVGLVGVRQVGPDGELQYTIRRFPSALRWLGEALASESWPIRSDLFGERELSREAYGHPVVCDWTAGSFMLARRAALTAVGGLEEGYFLYCEEPDLCLRLHRAGWRVEHRPELTVVHHGGNEASDPRHAAQLAYAKRLYMEKHFSWPGRIVATAALFLGYSIRGMLGGKDPDDRGGQRARARAALAALMGRRRSPFAAASSGP